MSKLLPTSSRAIAGTVAIFEHNAITVPESDPPKAVARDGAFPSGKRRKEPTRLPKGPSTRTSVMSSSPRRLGWGVPAYAGSVLGALALFFVIRAYGETLSAPSSAHPAVSTAASVSPPTDTLWHLLIALTTIVTVGRLLGRLFRRIGQPPVIGEVIGGVLLGPSLLGMVSPAAYHFVPGTRGSTVPERSRATRRCAVHVSGRRRAKPRSYAWPGAFYGGDVAC